MSEANAPVRLLYRDVPLAEPPAVQAAADGVFVALSTPPPVRTVLRLVQGDGSVRAIEVTRVVEVDGSDDRGERGFYARFVEGDVLAASDRVGSEHLSAPDFGPMAGEVDPESTDEADPSDAGHVAMAMPAPVVVDDDDEDGADSDGTAAESEDAGSRPARARKRRAKKPRK